MGKCLYIHPHPSSRVLPIRKRFLQKPRTTRPRMFVLLLPDPAGLRITLPMVVYVCVCFSHCWHWQPLICDTFQIIIFHEFVQIFSQIWTNDMWLVLSLFACLFSWVVFFCAFVCLLPLLGASSGSSTGKRSGTRYKRLVIWKMLEGRSYHTVDSTSVVSNKTTGTKSPLLSWLGHTGTHTLTQTYIGIQWFCPHLCHVMLPISWDQFCSFWFVFSGIAVVSHVTKDKNTNFCYKLIDEPCSSKSGPGSRQTRCIGKLSQTHQTVWSCSPFYSDGCSFRSPYPARMVHRLNFSSAVANPCVLLYYLPNSSTMTPVVWSRSQTHTHTHTIQ